MKFYSIAVLSLAGIGLLACSNEELTPVPLNCVSSKKTAVRLASTVTCLSDPSKQCGELDIIVRDFQSNHPDFENFQNEAYSSMNSRNALTTWVYPGYLDDATWSARRMDYGTWGCGNMSTPTYGIPIGSDGYPKAMQSASGAVPSLPSYLLSKVSTAGYTWYGEYKNCSYDATLNPNGLKVMRGFAHELCTSEATTATWTTSTSDAKKSCDGICKDHSWSQIVYVTPGMVAPYLSFDSTKGDDMMYEPTIVRNRYACDNGSFEQWFADYDAAGNSLQAQSINARANTVLQLPLVAGTKNTYEIDYNWNNGGYFPLDVVDANNNWIGTNTTVHCHFGNTSYGSCQFGPQSLSIFCPPYDYQWASTQTDNMGESTAALCQAWLANGGPKTTTAAYNAAAISTIGLRHLRNYHFTMMGYGKFKYNKGGNEIFEFASADDMWVYIDGVLAVDLGGTHQPAPGKADMDFLGANAHGCHAGEPLAGKTGTNENCDLDVDGTWKNGSWHNVHFFYANRQTDGSQMKIHLTSSDEESSQKSTDDSTDSSDDESSEDDVDECED